MKELLVDNVVYMFFLRTASFVSTRELKPEAVYPHGYNPHPSTPSSISRRSFLLDLGFQFFKEIFPTTERKNFTSVLSLFYFFFFHRSESETQLYKHLIFINSKSQLCKPQVVTPGAGGVH